MVFLARFLLSVQNFPSSRRSLCSHLKSLNFSWVTGFPHPKMALERVKVIFSFLHDLCYDKIYLSTAKLWTFSLFQESFLSYTLSPLSFCRKKCPETTIFLPSSFMVRFLVLIRLLFLSTKFSTLYTCFFMGFRRPFRAKDRKLTFSCALSSVLLFLASKLMFRPALVIFLCSVLRLASEFSILSRISFCSTRGFQGLF